MEEKTIEQEELGALTEQVELATQELGKIESNKRSQTVKNGF